VEADAFNDRSFKDHERTLEEINFYFSTLCIFVLLLIFLIW
jgi:hypothetical protein